MSANHNEQPPLRVCSQCHALIRMVWIECLNGSTGQGEIWCIECHAGADV